MKVRFLLLAMLPLLLLSGSARSQFVSGRFSTAIYSFERFDTVNSSSAITRAYQTVLLDITGGNLSFHTSLYGATNLSQSYDNDGEIRVNNLFLRWTKIANMLDASIGRIPVFAGVGNGIVDGAYLTIRNDERRMTITGYGGANVQSSLSTSGRGDLDKNYLVGAQVLASVFNESRVGVSYVNRRIERENYTALRPDSMFNPIPVAVTPDSRAEQALGIDARYAENTKVTGFGRYEYDVNLKRSRRVELGAHVTATEMIAFNAAYIYREPRLYYNSFFTVFSTAPVREYQGGIEYQVVPSLRTFANVAYVQYEGDFSTRLTIGLNHEYGSLSFAGTNGYAGELSSVNIQGMYPLLDRKVVPFAGFSFAAVRFDEQQADLENTYTGSLGAVVRPTSALSGDVQVQWLRNAIVEHDVRFFLKLSYWVNHDLKLFGGNGENK